MSNQQPPVLPVVVDYGKPHIIIPVFARAKAQDSWAQEQAQGYVAIRGFYYSFNLSIPYSKKSEFWHSKSPFIQFIHNIFNTAFDQKVLFELPLSIRYIKCIPPIKLHLWEARAIALAHRDKSAFLSAGYRQVCINKAPAAFLLTVPAHPWSLFFPIIYLIWPDLKCSALIPVSPLEQFPGNVYTLRVEKVFHYRDEVNAFLQDIARALRHNTSELIFNITGIAILILLIIGGYLVARTVKKRKREKAALNRFYSIVEKKSLSGRDRELLDFIVLHNKKARHLLPGIITDIFYFGKYTHQLVKKNLCTYTELALLRNHLGLKHKVLPVTVHSTADFFQGMTLRLTFSRSGRCKGVVRAVEDTGLVFRLNLLPRPGEKVQLEYTRIAGYYQVFSNVVQCSKEQVIIGHTENISRVQKRAFPRKPVKIPVGIQYPGDPDFMETQLMDLSGCGARIWNPGLKPANNQQVILRFNHAKDSMLTVPGRVVRVDRDNTWFGIAFGTIKERIRDKIMYLAKEKKQRQ